MQYRATDGPPHAPRSQERLRELEHRVTRGLADAASMAEGVELALRELCEPEGWACGEYWPVDEAAGVLRFGGRWDALPADTRAIFQRGEAYQFPPGVGLAGRVWETGQPLWVADVMSDGRMLRKDLARDAGLHGAFLFPTLAAGRVLGVFAFWSQSVRAPDEPLMQAFHAIGSQVGQFFKRQQAEQVLRDSEARFRALTALSSDWFWSQDADGCYVSVEGSVGTLDTTVAIGRRPQQLGLVPDTGWPAYEELRAARKPFRDLLFEGHVQGRGIVLMMSGEPLFDGAGRFTGYHGVARDVSERRQAEERIRYLAMHDGLTGLPNRTMFGQILIHNLATAKRYQRRFAVFFIDLDRFKTINDTLGHEAGDRLLVTVAERLKATLRASDVVARLGGDEFVVLLGETESATAAAAAARKLLAAVMRPMEIAGHECRVTASIGISLFPDDATDEATLLKNADTAMYLAKESGKNAFQVYDGAVRTQAMERLAIETELRRALERDELTLQFQAKLDLADDRITGVEALLRWTSPKLGPVSPAQFIPVAEESGLIVPIGQWVLRAACAQGMAWQREGLPPVRMAVNLSPRQFSDPHLLDDLRKVLVDTGLAPELLELEITESMVMADTERAIALLGQMKSLGVRLAIDDFGTGYSSLAQLKRFPIDTLKVDRSFIRDLVHSADDKAITEAIITMGKKLKLTVVAEGVETSDQMALLREQACDEMQGYHFSRPVPAEQFATLLRDHRPAPR